MNKIIAALCGVGLVAVGAVVAYIALGKEPSIAQEPPPSHSPTPIATATTEGAVVADALDQPAGLTVQPETGHLFVSLRDRIVRIVPGDHHAVHDEITGFPTDNFGKGPTYAFGPLGLACAGKDTLIVGDGSQPDGQEIVRIYRVGPEPLARDKGRTVNDMASFSTPVPPGDDSFQGEGNFFGVAVHGSTVFVTSNGDDSKGWICKLELKPNRSAPLPLVPFIKSKELTDVNAPMGATRSPDGKLVVCQFGAINKHPDSLLTIYDPATGALEQSFKTGLPDLISVAYQPQTGKLFGLDFSWAAPSNGGLYRLEPAGDQLTVVKLATLDRPTALAFDPVGQLYVTTFGAPGETGKKTGQLLVFKGL